MYGGFDTTKDDLGFSNSWDRKALDIRPRTEPDVSLGW